MSRFAKPVPADRKDTYYTHLPLKKLLAEIKEGITVITRCRLQMNAEMRKRLLLALLALRKRTFRKHPGYYETLASVGLNGDTVRQWFYRSHTADEVIGQVEKKQPTLAPVSRKGRPKPDAEPTDLWDAQIYKEHLDKLAAAVLSNKITYAKRLATEYVRVRDEDNNKAA